jgi:hypothetical protein
MRGWLNLKDLRRREGLDWLRFRSRSVIITTIIIAGITIITITTIIITRAYKEKGRSGGRSFFLPASWRLRVAA